MVEDVRSGVINRTDDIVRSINVRGTDYLDRIAAVCRNLCHDSCHVLIYVRTECRLDYEYVIVTLHR